MSNFKEAKKLEPVVDPACWYPDQFSATTRWQYTFSNAEIDELRALAVAVRRGIGDDASALLHLTDISFRAGAVANKVARMFSELKEGYGVVLLRGLPIAEMELLDAAIIYWAIGREFGVACPNNPQGDIFGHITDLGKTQRDANSRGYQTREAMDYHCDQCDIVGLLCIRSAKEGGVSKLTSSVAMYNTLLKENPRFVEVLSEPLCWTKHGEHAPDEAPFYQSPVFNFLGGKLCTSFGPKHIYKGHQLEDTPALTSEQQQALARAEAIADELHIEMALQPGDMQFVNNYVSLHTRSAYVDFDEPTHKRLLWRLWLMNDGLRSRTDYAKQWAKGVSLGSANAHIRLQ